jgi:hypothetical protein
MPLHGVVQNEDHWSKEYDGKGLKLWNYWNELLKGKFIC